MSIITNIRNRAGLLVAIIGLAILSFLAMDVFSGNGIFSNRPTNVAGQIDGEEVSIQYFETRVQEAVDNYKANTQQDKVDEATTAMLRDQVWNELVKEHLITTEYGALGLGVGLDELFDMVQGTNIHSSVRQAFSNPQTGEFDRNQVVTFLRNLDQQPEDMQKRWSSFEKFIKQERETQKYNSLISAGLYVTTAAAKRSQVETGRSFSGRFILLDYASIVDTTLQIEESELKAYYEDNSKDFEQKEESRSLEFVVFDVQPTADDSVRTRQVLTDLLNDFASTDNDSLFIALNSDLPYADSWVKEDQFTTDMEKMLFMAPEGSMSDIYLDNNYFKVTKVVAKGSRPDSVRARHILVPVANNDEVGAKAKADSLKVLVDGGADFGMIAMTNSTDQGSAVKGGDLGFFAEGMMVKPFNDACFSGDKGDIVLVRSDFGYHIINITDKKGLRSAVKYGTIVNEIQSSTDTYRDVFAKANKFQGESRGQANFNENTETEGLVKRTAENIKIGDRAIPGFQNAREIVRWVFKAEQGDVSSTFELEDRYVVASLSKISEKGTRAFEDVKTEVEAAVRKDKKGDKLAVQAKAAQAKAKNDMDGLARELNNVVQNYSGATFQSNFMPAMGRELAVLGKASKAEKGKVIGPLKGERGVYLVIVDAIVEAPATTDFSPNKINMSAQLASRAQNESINALKERIDINDTRYNFY